MKTTLGFVFATVSIVILAGCGAKNVKKDKVYTAQANGKPTAILQSDYVINGVIMPDSRGKQTLFTRPDKRRMDLTRTYDSWISRRIFGEGNQKDIVRVDKGLVWAADNKKKTYIECPLEGCNAKSLNELLAGGKEENEEVQEYNPEEGDAICPLKVVKRDFTVKNTGQTRSINGFPAKLYQASWVVVSQDPNKKQDVSRLTADFWTTPETGQMQQAWKIHGQFHNNVQRKLGTKANPLARFVNSEIYKALAAFSGDTSKNRAWHNDVTRKMSTIKGYPVSVKMEWRVENKACIETVERAKKDESIKDLKSLKNAVSGFFSKKAKNVVKNRFGVKDGEPIFRYIYDVKKLQLVNQNESLFDKPNYKLVTRD